MIAPVGDGQFCWMRNGSKTIFKYVIYFGISGVQGLDLVIGHMFSKQPKMPHTHIKDLRKNEGNPVVWVSRPRKI